MFKLVFDIEPVPASRPRVTRWGVYYQKTYEQFRNDMKNLMLQIKKTLYAEPLKLDVTFFIKIPTSLSKKKRDGLNGKYCVSKMDLDNLEKAIYDSMNGHVYVDDKQIVEHTTRKIWVKDNPRIEVIIKTL